MEWRSGPGGVVGRSGLRTLLTTLTLFAFGATPALAHASLESSEPAAGAVVSQADNGPLSEVELRFSEGIEVAFSSFKVYRIDGDVDLSADDATMRLNALAAVLVTEYNGNQDDGEGRVAAEVATAPADKSLVTISFEEPLAPGSYVVMWRVLSVDTHTVDGHVIFSVGE